jgi:hypothetical protein
MTKRWVAPILMAIAIVLTGCLGSFGDFGDFGFDEDDFPMPTVLAVYSQGSATVEVKQGDTTQTIGLTRVAAGSQLMSIAGGNVTWRNDDGWGLQITTIDMSMDFGPRPSPSAGTSPGPTTAPYLAELAVIRIADHDFWRASGNGAQSGNRCIVDLTEASASRVAGTATCRGLRWYDGTTSPMLFDQIYIEGQDPFDAEITFEATP